MVTQGGAIGLIYVGGVLEASKCKALRLRAKEHTEVCD